MIPRRPRPCDDRSDPGVASPCVRNCCLDDDDVCLGCGRLLQEILAWGGASDEERRAIVARAEQRLSQRRS